MIKTSGKPYRDRSRIEKSRVIWKNHGVELVILAISCVVTLVVGGVLLLVFYGVMAWMAWAWPRRAECPHDAPVVIMKEEGSDVTVRVCGRCGGDRQPLQPHGKCPVTGLPTNECDTVYDHAEARS